jgi:hypothetical protein
MKNKKYTILEWYNEITVKYVKASNTDKAAEYVRDQGKLEWQVIEGWVPVKLKPNR